MDPEMPRPKTYSRHEAVSKACSAFWQHGFQALGVRELERQTGINQFAIRSEFGGKEGLLLEALQHYCRAAIASRMAPMKSGGILEITTFLKGLVTPASMTSSEFGCLVVNTGIENARIQSPRLEKAIQAYWATLEDHFCAGLENERNAQGGKTDFDPAAVAKGLVPAVMGIHVQNRTQCSQTAGLPLVNLLCSALSDLRPS